MFRKFWDILVRNMTSTPKEPKGIHELNDGDASIAYVPMYEQKKPNHIKLPERYPSNAADEKIFTMSPRRLATAPVKHQIKKSRSDYTKIKNKHIVNLKPYKATYKPNLQLSEDRIFTGILDKRYPIIIVADGASTSIRSGVEISGQGGKTAELAMKISKTELTKLFKNTRTNQSKNPTLVDIIKKLKIIYKQISKTITQRKLNGSTTLLIAMLVENKNVSKKSETDTYWVYSYLGDGRITLFNPLRQINKWLIPTFLVSPGHHLPGGGTATLPSQFFQPIIGAITHEPGDILYVASDGIESVEKTLFARTQVDFSNMIWRANFHKLNKQIPVSWIIPDIESVKLSDDLSIGMIWTGD